MAEKAIAFLEHLLEAVEHKRELSIREFRKTDLNKDIDLASSDHWYRELGRRIMLDPPISHVKGVYIEENDECIIAVKYEYSESPMASEEISFVIHFLSDKRL